ncbi:hypothetical protein B0H17DRAFT_1149150 [Mycena rosella]|uniref:Uncharacterized protein n=1 Tax=Mycena rosella TaxID=1033263 RepID=A0AAD7C692_MYCRO|nr:hypothetical protein B0H17DRAFT_1149150 [Mycena rosella]
MSSTVSLSHNIGLSAWLLSLPSQTSSDKRLDLARDWDQFLHPLVAKHFSTKFFQDAADRTTTFTDAEGRALDLGHTEPSYFVPDLLIMLKAEKDDSIEVPELDKGNLYFTLQKHPSGKWVISQTRVNLYGWIGNFTDYVMVEDLGPLVKMLEVLAAAEDE